MIRLGPPWRTAKAHALATIRGREVKANNARMPDVVEEVNAHLTKLKLRLVSHGQGSAVSLTLAPVKPILMPALGIALLLDAKAAFPYTEFLGRCARRNKACLRFVLALLEKAVLLRSVPKGIRSEKTWSQAAGGQVGG
jgi:hypothetical protein